MKSVKYQDLLKLYSQTSITNFNEVIKSPFPTLFDLTEKYGGQVTKLWLYDQLADYAQFVNAGKSFSKEQLDQTVDLIIMAYSNMNMTDFKLFFNKCRLGHYGKIYDVLDGQILLSWLLEYKSERINSAEHLSIVEASNFKKKELEPAPPLKADESGYSQFHIDAIKSLLNEVNTKVNTIDGKGKIVKQTQGKQAKINTEQRWMRQFNNLRIGSRFRNYSIDAPIMMIQVGSLKPMSITEFLHYKLNG